MQTSSLTWIRVLLIAVLIIVGWWVIHDRSATNEQLSLEVQQLKQQVAQLKAALSASEAALSAGKERVAQLESELQAIKKQSIQGVLEQTNKALTDGWQKLLNTINKELGEARNEVQGASEEPQTEESGSTLLEKPELKKLDNPDNIPDTERETDSKGKYDTQAQPLENKHRT